MGFTFTYKTFGVDQIKAGFSRFGKMINDWRPLWKDIGKDFYRIELKQFGSEGGRKRRWKELTPAYRKQKEKKFPGRSILVAVGDMKRSLISRSHSNSVYELRQKSFEIGTKDPKARWHFIGAGTLPKGAQARRPIDLTAGDKTRWSKMIHAYMVRTVQAAGFKIGG